MGKIVRQYFKSDIPSATIALLVLVATVCMLIGHICIKAGAFSCFLDLLFCLMGWNLVSAVYHENKNNDD